MEIDIFIPAYVDQISPNTGLNMVSILNRFNVTTHYNPEQTDIGENVFNNGNWEDAKLIGQKFIDDFDTDRYVVSPCYSAVYHVRNYFDEMFYNSSFHNKYHKLKDNLFEFSEFLTEILKISSLNAVFNYRISFLNPLMMNQNSIFTVLNFVRGLTIVDVDGNETPGFYESFLIPKFDFIRLKTAEDYIEKASKLNVDYIVTTDTHVIEYLNSAIANKNSNIKTIHLIDLINYSENN
ncbi:MAG: hypothetical protein ACOXZ9_10675 [Bacteroidales bacterium]|jgi:L-lactate dehydrogenase complex protein LldE